MVETIVCRPRAALWLCIAVWVIAAVGLASLIVQREWEGLARFGAVPLLAAWCAWMLFGAPSVRISASALTLANVVRTVRIPWGAVTDVEAGLSMRVRTGSGTFSAWAAPGGQGASTLTTLSAEAQLASLPGALQFTRAADRQQMDTVLGLDRSATSSAAGTRQAIQRAWQAFGAVAALTDAPGAPETHWNRASLAVLAGLAALVVVGAVV